MRGLAQLIHGIINSSIFELNFLLLSGLLLIPFLSASAQTTPKVELFTGYAYSDSSFSVPKMNNNFDGINLSVTGNFTGKFGVVGDFNAGFNGENNYQTYLFGPKFTARKGNLSVFTQLYLGGARLDARAFGGNRNTTVTSYAAGVGAGIDYRINDRFSVRVIQADLIGTKFNERPQAIGKLSFGFIFNLTK